MSETRTDDNLFVVCDLCGWDSGLPILPHVTMRRLRWMKRRLDLRFEAHWWRVHFRESFRKAS